MYRNIQTNIANGASHDVARKIEALSEAIRLHRELNQLIFSYLKKFAKSIEDSSQTS